MKRNKLLVITASLIFAVFFGFWIVLGAKGWRGESDQAELFSALYGLMALFGGVAGLFISKKWGGHKSYIGRAVLLVSLGLLAQEFGQITYSAYTYLFHQEIPYPSLGDLGYFGSVIFYIFAVINIIKATSLKISLGSLKKKTVVVLIPLALLAGSYFMFLRGYEFDFSQPLTVFLDLGYPLGQAFYIALAILAFLLSRKYLGGLMRPVILFLLFALVWQYAADFTFLYQVSRETWETGGSNELIYLIAYFVMTLALVRFNVVISKLSGKKDDIDELEATKSQKQPLQEAV